MVEHKAREITLFSCGNTNRMKVKPGREFRLGGEDPKGVLTQVTCVIELYIVRRSMSTR